METTYLEKVLEKFTELRIAVIGDFFLDLYIHLDRRLSEFSLETHKEAFQATAIRPQPGSAGVVAQNLAALSNHVSAIGYVGEDGYGYELIKALSGIGVDTSYLLMTDERVTPVYTKPLMCELDGSEVELNRIDILNRTPNTLALNKLVTENLSHAVAKHDGILVLEQVQSDGCGVLSHLVREKLAELAIKHPEKVFLVDSRHHTSKYQYLCLKMNLAEAMKAIDPTISKSVDDVDKEKIELSHQTLQSLWLQTKKPSFITLGEQGISGIDQTGVFHHPGFVYRDPIDVVGAGDAVLAGIGLALCAGAEPVDAAYVGNLIGSIIVRQIGTTGVAHPDDILNQHFSYQQQIKEY